MTIGQFTKNGRLDDAREIKKKYFEAHLDKERVALKMCGFDGVRGIITLRESQ